MKVRVDVIFNLSFLLSLQFSVPFCPPIFWPGYVKLLNPPILTDVNDLSLTWTVFYYTFSQTIKGKYKCSPYVNHFPPESEPAPPDPAVFLLSKLSDA